ncbi:hypothetical protein GQ53DRAFT_636865 [Thozetella sp. PMI_491]|nr:hypothetical protein GQ53DRAFT_636865 [Thozetella sp. PMI_491]
MSVDENNACLDSLNAKPHHEKMRIEREKGDLLRDSYRWVLDHVDFQRWRNSEQGELLLITGDPGKGKTMLLCGIIDELIYSTAHTANVSFFFCQADHNELNRATAVLRGLIYMIVKQQPPLISYLREVYDDGKHDFGDGKSTAWDVLKNILDRLLRDANLRTTYLIIDALDECTDGLDLLLQFIRKQIPVYSRVKCIVSSRNWPEIVEPLHNVQQQASLPLELNKDTISAAVATYIRYTVAKLAEEKNYDDETRGAIQNHLLTNANDTFLWVALVCKVLNQNLARYADDDYKNFPPGLNGFYKRMLERISESRETKLCKSILAVVTALYEPVTLDELVALIDMSYSKLDKYRTDNDRDKYLTDTIALCGSLLTVSNRVVSLVHKSAKDFLLEKEQRNIIFPCGIDHVHHSIFLRSLQVMTKTLRRDIYQLGAPGCLIDQVQRPNPDRLAAARYSCIYWVDHLHDSSSKKDVKEDLQDDSELDGFLRQKYLYWLEALSLLGSISSGMFSMAKLEGLVQGDMSQLADMVRDGRRFLQYCRAIVEKAPLQLYASALVFSPTYCLTRTRFQGEEPTWIITKLSVEDDWSACLQTFDHGSLVFELAWSPDGCQIASASIDGTVKIWDLAGQCLKTLEGHSGLVHAVAWSPDGRQIASASDDRTVKTWNLAGQCLKTLKGHSLSVYGVVWSLDGRQIASVSGDGIIKIWDPAGQCLKTFNGHSHWTFNGHSHWVKTVAWSPDGRQIASASGDGIVKIWDLAGQCLKTFKAHSYCVNAVAWSPDGRQIASALDDGTVKIWDQATGQCSITLKIGSVTNVRFETSHLLYTDIGIVDLCSNKSSLGIIDSIGYSTVGYGFSKTKHWITHDEQRLLWLPPGFRPSASAILGRDVVIGCSSGHILFIRFLPHGSVLLTASPELV